MDEEILVPLVIGSPAAVRDIGIAGQATLICTEDGSVYVNGRFLSQTLWQYDTGDEVDMPGAVGDFFLSDLWSNRNIRSLSGGADHNTRGNHFFLIDADGVLYAF